MAVRDGALAIAPPVLPRSKVAGTTNGGRRDLSPGR
jgi:hypothetical protein